MSDPKTCPIPGRGPCPSACPYLQVPHCTLEDPSLVSEDAAKREAEIIDAWAARITGEDVHPSIASTAECVCRHGSLWGECFECCGSALRSFLSSVRALAAPAPAPRADAGDARLAALEEAARAVMALRGGGTTEHTERRRAAAAIRSLAPSPSPSPLAPKEK